MTDRGSGQRPLGSMPNVTVRNALCISGITVMALLAAPAWAADIAPPFASSMPPASFACDRAELVDEQIICSDALLRQADHALGKSFAALMAATSDAARREALRSDEHTWIIRRNRECGVVKATKVTDADRPGYVD